MAQHVGEITDRYYTTTSSRSGAIGELHYELAKVTLTRRLGAWLPGQGATVLDLGCGWGAMCHVALIRGAALTVGVNLCAEEIELARNHVRGEFVQEDITAYLRTEKRRFDWIGCLNILEHLPKDRVVESLRLARERLTPGGVLVAMVPNALSPMSALTRHWDFTHEWAFTPNNFRQLAALCGFESPEFRECGPIPHGLVSGVRFVLWKAIRLLIAGYLLVEVADRKDGIYTMDMLVRMRTGKGKPG